MGTGAEPSAPDATRRPIGELAVGAVLVAVILLAAGTAVLRPFTDGAVDRSSEWLRAALGAAGASALVAVGWALWRRNQRLTHPAGWPALSGAATVLVAVIVISVGATAGVATLHVRPERAAPPTPTTIDRPERPAPPPATEVPEQPGQPRELPSWLATVLAVIASVLAALLVLAMFRSIRMPVLRIASRLRHGQVTQSGGDAEVIDLDAAADSFDESAAIISDGSDPRQAIIAAYAHLLERLDDAGAKRYRTEAPEEHLRRSLRELEVPSEAMVTVVDRFLIARFSTHPLTDVDRDIVAAALRDAGAQLREITARRRSEAELTSAAATMSSTGRRS